MGIEVKWDNDDKTIVRITFEGRWTWGEFRVAVHEAWALQQSVDYDVDTLLNMSNGNRLPTGSALQHAKYVVQNRPENAGTMVFVGGGPILDSLGKVFYQIYSRIAERATSRFCKTEDEAYAIIAEAVAARRDAETQ